MNNLNLKVFKLDASQNATAVEDFAIDSNVESVLGVCIASDRADLVWSRGRVGVEIAGKEILTEGSPAKMLISGSSVKPMDRFFAIGELPFSESSDRRIKVRYADQNVTGTTFSAHIVEVLLLVKIKR